MRGQLVRFAGVGVVGFAADSGTLYLGLHLGLGYFIGRAVSFLSAVGVTWYLNRRFTFPGGSGAPLASEGWRYLAAMSIGGAVNFCVYCAIVLGLSVHATLLANTAKSLIPLTGVAAGSAAGLVVNFSLARFWVYRRSG